MENYEPTWLASKLAMPKWGHVKIWTHTKFYYQNMSKEYWYINSLVINLVVAKKFFGISPILARQNLDTNQGGSIYDIPPVEPIFPTSDKARRAPTRFGELRWEGSGFRGSRGCCSPPSLEGGPTMVEGSGTSKVGRVSGRRAQRFGAALARPRRRGGGGAGQRRATWRLFCSAAATSNQH